jgi:dolichol-phosphate mannosyltransferase
MDTISAEWVELTGPEVTVVLPTYNERKNIPPMFERLKSALRDFRWEIVVVDDNSSDGTAEAVRAIGTVDRRVRCIRRVDRRGLSGACVEGALAAQAPIIVIMDADQQHDEQIVPQMIELLRTNCYDLVVGTRYSRGGSVAGLHGYRRQTSRVANVLARCLTGASVSDAMSGFFAIRRDVVDVLAPELSPDGFKLLLDVLTRRMRLKIGEVPYEFRPRQEGESKLGVRVALDFAALVLSRLTRNILPQRFLLFCVVGLSGVAVHLGALFVLRTLGFAFNSAQVMAALVAVATNFWLNNLLTYRGQALRGWQAVRGLLIFYVICTFGLISNISVADWIVASTETWTVAGGVGAIMSAVWNYVVSATFVWGTTVNAKAAEKLGGVCRSVPPLGANLRPEGVHAVLAQRSWWPLALLGVYVTMRIALDAWWLSQFRDGYPLNTDEVGYLTFALDDTQGLKSGGIAGLWHAYLGNRLQAPLVPLLTVPIHLVFGEEIFSSFFVQTPFLVLLAFTSYGLAARLASPSWGLLAALIVTSIPEMTDWARTFHFGVPAAALFTAAIYALVRAEGLADRGWALAWGLLLGLTLLSRTMMIALIPGLALAAMLTVVYGPTERKRRAVNFGLAMAVGFAIAATWYGRNWPIVAEYLLSYGYGDRSVYHGQAYPMLSWAYWTARLNTIINGFYLPLAVLVAATLVVGIAQVLLQTRETRRIGGALRLNLQNVVWICSVVVVSGYLALASSRNEGTGFALPLLPILVALAMAAAARLRSQAVRACLVAAFLLVSLFNVVMKADVAPAFSGSWSVPVPALGALRVIDGSGDIQRLLTYAGNDVGPPTARMPEVHKQWLALGREVVTWLDSFADRHQRQPIVVFASNDPFFNTNLIGLSARLHLRRRLWVGQLEPTRGGDNTEAYRVQLTDPRRGPPNLVVTTDPGPSEYKPSVTQARAENVARSLGFQQVGSFHLPDGRETRVWWLDRGAEQ